MGVILNLATQLIHRASSVDTTLFCMINHQHAVEDSQQLASLHLLTLNGNLC